MSNEIDMIISTDKFQVSWYWVIYIAVVSGTYRYLCLYLIDVS